MKKSKDCDMFAVMKMVAGRPSLWGLHQFSDFVNFMQGCNLIWHQLGVGDLFGDFQGWVSIKYHRPPNIHWSFILTEAWGNDKEGIEKFVVLFEEFRDR